IARYGDELGRSCWKEFAQKRLDVKAADDLNHKIARDWNKIRNTIAAIFLTSTRFATSLNNAGAPVTPEAIHLPRGFYEQALLRCREIRNRFTFLDLAAGAGLLEKAIPSL
ncbi:MAG: sn-glycerol-1-phosphate dehydrogenase, partial [Parvibaculaceae bacterium]